MIKKIVFLLTIIIAISCNNSAVEKPEKFIDEEQFENIVFDLALLEGIKTQPFAVNFDVPSAKELLKNKYNIDSLTYIQNLQYYASDFKNYRHLNNRVKKRLEEEEKRNNKSKNVPQLQLPDEGGIVK